MGSEMCIRDSQSIEESRSEGIIKGSLDASIDLTLDADDFKLLNKFATEIHFFFIVSECIVSEGEALKISVKKLDEAKCVRCWHRHKSVGSSELHRELCYRCEQNIDGSGEDRQFA